MERSSATASTRSQAFTRFIFWVAFISFLSMSIPHTAWLYDLYEPSGSLPLLVVSYGIAISIDVMICWLSYTLASGEKRTERFTAWLFIGSLSLLSWYANYLYSIAHEPVNHGDIWTIPVLFGLTTTGYISPLIVSAIPLFTIAYTFMLSRVGKVESLEEMQARLQEERTRRKIQQEFDELQKGRFTRQMKEGLTGLFEVTKHVVNEASSVVEKREPDQKLNSSPALEIAQQSTGPALQDEPIRDPFPPLEEHDEHQHERESEPISEMLPSLVHCDPENEHLDEPGEPQESGKVGWVVLQFIEAERAAGREPTIAQIMNQAGCSKGTASKYKNRTTGAQLRAV